MLFRSIAMADIVQALKRLENLRGKDLRRLPPTAFVVKTPYGFEMAIIKSQDIDTKQIDYTVTTVSRRLKQGAGQRVIYLENNQPGTKVATAKQVLDYINRTHHQPFEPDNKMATSVLAYPRWELVQVPLLNLNIPDQEYDDIDYNEYEPEMDPYGRQMLLDPKHAGQVSAKLVDRKPIVIDADRYIIDGNHRAWAAKYLLNRDYIQAWRPVT